MHGWRQVSTLRIKKEIKGKRNEKKNHSTLKFKLCEYTNPK